MQNRLVFSLLPILLITLFMIFGVGCDKDYFYEGDGRFEHKRSPPEAPPFLPEGFNIYFPEMVIEPGLVAEYKVNNFPKKGSYSFFLVLTNATKSSDIEKYDLLGDYLIEIFQNDKLFKSLDSKNLKSERNISIGGNRTELYYLSTKDMEKSSGIKVSSLDDKWRFKISFYEGMKKEDAPINGFLYLRQGGGK